MRNWSMFPPGAVAIAGNGTADQLILLPREDNPLELSNHVFWWDHETGDVREVADDFADLVRFG